MKNNAKHHQLKVGLNRVKGQVSGVVRMIEEERYCIDILQQLNAVRKAIDKISLKMMRGHIDHCVSKAILEKHGTKKVDELMESIHRFVK